MKKILDRWKPAANKFSLEHLEYLFHNLVHYERNDSSQSAHQVVETLREIAELLVWGDQHNSAFFDYFLEKQMLQHFIKVRVLLSVRPPLRGGGCQGSIRMALHHRRRGCTPLDPHPPDKSDHSGEKKKFAVGQMLLGHFSHQTGRHFGV